MDKKYTSLDSGLHIDQRGVVVERAVPVTKTGIKCAHCLYGRDVYRELHNKSGTADSICKKYRPTHSTCLPQIPDHIVYVGVN